MNFTQSVDKCLRHYADFNGRSQRSEFWWFYLFGIIAAFVATFLDTIIFSTPVEDYGPLTIIADLALLIPTLAVGSRRLHDINRSGWWLLLVFTIIGIIVLIVWFATVGENKTNRFGKQIKIKN